MTEKNKKLRLLLYSGDCKSCGSHSPVCKCCLPLRAHIYPLQDTHGNILPEQECIRQPYGTSSLHCSNFPDPCEHKLFPFWALSSCLRPSASQIHISLYCWAKPASCVCLT